MKKASVARRFLKTEEDLWYRPFCLFLTTGQDGF